MHRSASTTRASDEFYMSMAAHAMGGTYQAGGLRSSLDADHHSHHLPTYDPQSDAAKKEASRVKVAENMVHVIPFVILLCTIILWFFSHPTAEINVMSKDDSVVVKIKNATTDGFQKWNGSSMTIGMEDLDPIHGIGNEDTTSTATSKNYRH